MKISNNGLDLIKRYEGLILGAYDDANDHIVQPGQEIQGTLTIGYGHTNAAGEPKVFPGQRITESEASDILANDLGKVESDVERLVKVPLNQNQFDALVSFHYNTGSLGKASALTYLNKGDYKTAASRLALYNKGRRADGSLVVMKGLITRRAEEIELFNKPVIPTQEVSQPMTLPFPLSLFISPDKIGSVVRAATASLLTSLAAFLALKVPFLAALLTPDQILFLSASAGTLVAGWFGAVSKNPEAPEKALDHSRKD